jgi:hypothetical protein
VKKVEAFSRIPDEHFLGTRRRVPRRTQPKQDQSAQESR